MTKVRVRTSRHPAAMDKSTDGYEVALIILWSKDEVEGKGNEIENKILLIDGV